MKRWQRFLAVACSGLMIISLTACGDNNKKTNAADKSVKTTEVKKKDKKASKSDTIKITDDAKRNVELPKAEELDKVYFTSPMGMIFVYTLAPEKLAGSSMKLSDKELEYMLPSVKELPMLGGRQNGSELNKEEIINSGAKMIVDIAPNGKMLKQDGEDADRLQEQLGLPVVVIDGSMDKVSGAYKLLGKILGEEKRAKELADYCEDVFTNVVDKMDKIPEDKRVNVYYAEQNDGLSTEPSTSSHAQVLNYAAAKNVATVESKAGGGMSPVSLEQVLSWNPEVIIAWGDDRGGCYSKIKEDADWQGIQAVEKGQIYAMPNIPFSWMDRPPSVNRFLGIQWVANLLYPEEYNIDIVKQAREFYKLFYHVDVSQEKMENLLKDSIKK